VSDRNGVGREGYVTPGIAELPDREKGLRGKVGNDMPMSGRRWKSWDVKVGLMCGVEYDARWGVNGNRGCGRVLVAHRCSRRKEVCSTTRISNGIKRSGGRTGNWGRH